MAFSAGLASTPHTAELSSDSVSSFHLPRLDTSLAAYHFKLNTPQCASLLAPMLRVSSLVTGESHYFPDVDAVVFHLHESSPFAPSVGRGVQIDIFQDPECVKQGAKRGEGADFVLKVDFAATIKKALQRYRLVFIPWASAIAFAIHSCQIGTHSTTSERAPDPIL